MAYTIAQPCVGVKDTACVEVCPVECIHPTKNEAAFAASEQLYIDPNTCMRSLPGSLSCNCYFSQ